MENSRILNEQMYQLHRHATVITFHTHVDLWSTVSEATSVQSILPAQSLSTHP